MAAPRCEWDHRKDAENQRKHRIAFEEARTVFADEHARLLDDPDHSGDEDRFILLGLRDRKSTRLNSSHSQISYAVFCLKKKKKKLQISPEYANPTLFSMTQFRCC